MGTITVTQEANTWAYSSNSTDEKQSDEAYEKYLADVKKRWVELHEKLNKYGKKIYNFDKDGKLKEKRREMQDAETKYQKEDKEILETFNKTGVNEDSIVTFLKLTHQLIGDTVSTQEVSNKLNA
eukprot:238472_1